MTKNIVIIGTLDTKGEEVRFISDLIEKKGHTPIIIDCGIMGAPEHEPTISRHEVAEAANTTLEKIIEKCDKNNAIQTMTKGVVNVACRLYDEHKLDGVISLGGVQGTVLATAAMRALPIGVPKVMVSTVANGKATFGPFIGTKDIMIMHSVADISGLNMITRKVLTQATGAIVGMVEMSLSEEEYSRPTVGVTMAGVTTPSVMKAREILEGLGYEVITFHCNGIGAEAMENLVKDGNLVGILDISPHDITDYLNGGIMPASPDRLRASCNQGIPQIIAPGCADIILYGALESVEQEMLERKYVSHNPIHTHVKANRKEMDELGYYIAERGRDSTGPVIILVPKLGFSQLNIEGGPLFEPESDQGFVEGIKKGLSNIHQHNVKIKELNMHINDATFSEYAAKLLDAMIKQNQEEVNELIANY